MRSKLGALFALFWLLAPSGADATPFQKGAKRITATLGAGNSYGGNYLILGLGAGYYLFQGLGVGVDLEGWFLDTPSIWRISPEVHYVMVKVRRLQPYVGGFYGRTFVDGRSDLDTLGGRGGVMFRGAAYWVGLGLVWEKNLNCDTSTSAGCSATYPEARFTILL